jgi:hypothetical protein
MTIAARRSCLALVVAMILVCVTSASAQDPVRPTPAVDIVKRVVLDPTTYAPAVISYEGHHLDWKSSQVFFQHGFLEHSAEFTLSGHADWVNALAFSPDGATYLDRDLVAATFIGLDFREVAEARCVGGSISAPRGA